MRFSASVSFEYDTRAPQTSRTEIDVPNARLGARRALEAAQRMYPSACWRSAVIVLERLDIADVEANARQIPTAEVIGQPIGQPILDTCPGHGRTSMIRRRLNVTRSMSSLIGQTHWTDALDI
jgi:hypothetical protein